MLQLTKIRKDIGTRLRSARKAARITLQEAGVEVGRSKQAVLAWEAGSSDVSAVQLAALAALYGVTADQILFGVSSVAMAECLDVRRLDAVAKAASLTSG